MSPKPTGCRSVDTTTLQRTPIRAEEHRSTSEGAQPAHCLEQAFSPKKARSYDTSLDQPVSVRGLRIELKRVEQALCTHPMVREALVVAWEGDHQGSSLVAYLVASGSEPLALLESHMAERLPRFMVPKRFVMLPGLPKGPDGLVDRRALLTCQGSAPRAATRPFTPREEMVASIWAEVLGVEQVGLHQDFFELGGHSLLASQVTSRLEGLFGVQIPLRTLFERPTVGEFAAYL